MKRILCTVLVVMAVVAAYKLGRARTPQPATGSAHRVLYYVDPMHPAYRSSQPGIAPDCGMQLVPVYADAETREVNAATQNPAGTVTLDLEKQQLIGVQVVPVQTGAGTHTVRLLGRVAPEDTRLYRVTSAVQGWVQETSDDSVGNLVKKDQRLAAYYSPEFVTFVNGYLAAAERGTTEMKEFVRSVTYSADRLRALGVSDSQIREIGDSRQLPKSIYAVSPVDGFVVARNISPGMRFDRQTEFYQIADLSRVWILAEIFENEAQYFRPGTLARITIPGEHKTLTARVSNVLPQVDSATRTLKLRMEVANPGFVLRPNMFVDVELSARAPLGLTVPADAILDFGTKKRVFVDRGDGRFEPREVETGWQFGDRVQIVKGLSPNERVAASGTFLLDSESRLHTTTAAIVPPALPEEHKKHEAPPQARLKAARAEEVRDPVCGMMINAEEAARDGRAFLYREKTYYFCSRQDKDNFANDPERYLKGGREVASHDGRPR